MPRASHSALKTDKIPRPRNAFLIFRKVNIELIRSNIGKSHPVQMEISREAGRLWNGASPAVRGEYKRLAEIEKQEHALKYPGYVYRPR
ncbi:high mobility group box domain-containing protein, partial [Lentinula aciculospora]